MPALCRAARDDGGRGALRRMATAVQRATPGAASPS